MEEFLERVKHTRLSLRDKHIILDALPIPISWATIPVGNIQFMNRAFKETFGYNESHFSTVDAWIEQSYPKLEQQLLARQYWNRLWKADFHRNIQSRTIGTGRGVGEWRYRHRQPAWRPST